MRPAHGSVLFDSKKEWRVTHGTMYMSLENVVISGRSESRITQTSSFCLRKVQPQKAAPWRERRLVLRAGGRGRGSL